MLQQDIPQDYVIGTGITHSVRDLCEHAFRYVGLDYRDHVCQDELYYRPAEVDLLVADPAKAHATLGWRPLVDFEGLIRLMVDADLERLAREIG
jgi:GDPmannose 4,6-dehydratase